MEGITISRGTEVLAHHTTEHSRSSYGTPIWSVEVEEPEPGPATWSQGEQQIDMEILTVKSGWLVARQPDGLLCGIIWSDGSYYADLIVTRDTDEPCTELAESGQMVRGTVTFDDDDLGSILG